MFLLEIVKLGLANLKLHLLRSVLTALGIILGVAAVITMVSIGEGSKQEALAQLERLGARNIIVRSEKPAESNQSGQTSFVTRYGISYETLRVIESNFPDAEAVVPLKSVGSQVIRRDLMRLSQAYGVTPELLEAAGLRVETGRYITQQDEDNLAMVGVIGHELARIMFPYDNPLGNTIRIDEKIIEIVGVLAPVGLSGGAGSALVGRDMNYDLHIPFSTAERVFGDVVIRRESGSFSGSEVQVGEIYIVSPTRERVPVDASRIRRILEVRHPGMSDITMIVPFELLESARKSAMTWNLVLGAVAGISLLVGGIGIMNIMLASVTERTREIGVRRALGATRKHIVWQFLVETGVLSSLGGLLGIVLGVGLSVSVGLLVPMLPDLPVIGSVFPPNVELPTQITSWSIMLSFAVAAATGLIFGIYPAMVAAKQDPIVALRHD